MKKNRIIQIIREEIEKITNEDYRPSHRGYNVIDKNSQEIIDSNLPKHMALALAAKKNGWMIQATDQLSNDEPINEEEINESMALIKRVIEDFNLLKEVKNLKSLMEITKNQFGT